jgi:hypothetical protein
MNIRNLSDRWPAASAAMTAQDISYTTSALQVRLYDPNGNLVAPRK